MTAKPAAGAVETLGVIAGGGSLPARLVEACAEAGTGVFIVAFRGQTDPALYEGQDHLLTRPGRLGRIIRALKSRGVRDLVFIGSLRRPSFAELRPDLRAARLLVRLGLKTAGDDGLLSALRRELEQEGFVLRGVQDFARGLLAGRGSAGRLAPGPGNLDDIRRGVEVLKGTGLLDIGQAAVVQEGLVLGIEAIEGTDELIRRCVAYRRKGRGGVLVKLCKPGQDRDLDLPAIGPETVRLCAQAGLAGIAVHAGASLLADPQAVVELADRHGLFVTGVDPDEF